MPKHRPDRSYYDRERRRQQRETRDAQRAEALELPPVAPKPNGEQQRPTVGEVDAY